MVRDRNRLDSRNFQFGRAPVNVGNHNELHHLIISESNPHLVNLGEKHHL